MKGKTLNQVLKEQLLELPQYRLAHRITITAASISQKTNGAANHDWSRSQKPYNPPSYQFI